MQMTRTPSYIQIVGHIDQTTLNIQANDTGGEADPHGADHRGNPLGGVVYSSAFSKANTSGFVQVIEWNYFLGNGVFCFKACDPASPNAASLCEHVYDRIGCQYNMPADYKGINGVFQSCKGEDQLPVGVYEENGIRKVWKQPPESLGPITSVPYKPTIPLVSDCVTYTSSELFTETLPPAPTSVNPTAASVNKMSTPNTPSAQEAKNSGASLVPCLKRTIFFVLTMVTSYLVLAVGSAI
ncbi:hypothetical protein O181_027984 [Austropuccinia psidii MF-1]|uniref:Uncharacterized protein n=1 Tax=Austropuccinia psidii MF-1 TaxID=1389203 RepID=A0A9Q3CPW3_9BASI|nr:hypothetical protein [Austropuccinia psidii MF-1]